MTRPISFLSLPGELLNAIYELYASVHPSKAISVIDGELEFVWTPPLTQVSRQIRGELKSFASDFNRDLAQVVKVTTVVTDFDFSDIDLFLNRLKPHEPGGNPVPNVRDMHVELVFTAACIQVTAQQRELRIQNFNTWRSYMGGRWDRKDSGGYSVTFDPPDLPFEMSDFAVLLGKDLTCNDNPDAVRWAIRAAIQERNAYIGRQQKIEKLKRKLSEAQQKKEKRRDVAREIEYLKAEQRDATQLSTRPRTVPEAEELRIRAR